MSITGKIRIKNLSALHDASNNTEEMKFHATVYIEGHAFRSMLFNRLDSAHTFINMYLEDNKHGT